MKKIHFRGPVVLVVLDGVGLSLRRSGNAVRQAHTEFLNHAISSYPTLSLDASGPAVGILPGQMGNSEVGHIALGTGQIIRQDVAAVEAAFDSGEIWKSRAWQGMLKFLQTSSSAQATSPSARSEAAAYWRGKAGLPAHIPTLHFCGIFSDGGIHSDISHLERMIQRAYEDGVRRIRLHAVFDGRDVAPQSEPKFIDRIEAFAGKFKDLDFRIASGGGRMAMTADRYGNDWGMVKLGYDAMVRGRAPHHFRSAREAITTFRRQDPTIQDQYLPPFVVVDLPSRASTPAARAHLDLHAGKNPVPVGRIEDGDAVIYYDFRADRAIEITEALTAKAFTHFKRGAVPHIYFAGLTEYDADRHLPKNVLVPPQPITDSLSSVLGSHHISQLAISETVKFGHITYYFNGKSYKKAPGEKHIEIPSDVDTASYVTRPWMKCAEITDTALERLEDFQFVRINFPNGDMVGHFANLESTIVAMEALDIQLARLARKVDELGGMMLITADHGKAEELLDSHGQPRTAHSLNPVPCIFYDNTDNRKLYRLTRREHPGISEVSPTIATLLGLRDLPSSWRPPLINVL